MDAFLISGSLGFLHVDADLADDLFFLIDRFSFIALEAFIMSLLEYVRDVESPVAESFCQL